MRTGNPRNMLLLTIYTIEVTPPAQLKEYSLSQTMSPATTLRTLDIHLHMGLDHLHNLLLGIIKSVHPHAGVQRGDGARRQDRHPAPHRRNRLVPGRRSLWVRFRSIAQVKPVVQYTVLLSVSLSSSPHTRQIPMAKEPKP